MERARQKLHSRSGASILLALLLFLVAAMVCAVIVSASFTAAKRVYDDKTGEQDYLTVSSAAKTLKEGLLASGVTYTTTVTTTVQPDGTSSSETETSETPTGPLGAIVLAATKDPDVYSLTVDPSGGQLGGAVMDDFTVTPYTVTQSGASGFIFSGMLAAAGGQADCQKIYFSARAFREPDGTDSDTQDVEVPDGAGGTKTVTKTTVTITEKLTVGNVQLNTMKEETT